MQYVWEEFSTSNSTALPALTVVHVGGVKLHNLVMQTPLLQFGSFFGGPDTLSAVQALLQLCTTDLDESAEAVAVPTAQELQQQYGMSSGSYYTRMNKGVWRNNVESVVDFPDATVIVRETGLAVQLQRFVEKLLTTFSLQGCDFQWLFAVSVFVQGMQWLFGRDAQRRVFLQVSAQNAFLLPVTCLHSGLTGTFHIPFLALILLHSTRLA